MSDVSQIDGSAVRLCREAQGWAINDLAARACLSVKQVRQIEEGGLSSFYSESVKLTAARKIAGLLQLSEAQLFGQAPSVPPQLVEESLLFSAPTAPISLATSINPAAPSPVLDQAKSSGVHLMRSEALHVLAQPPEIDWTPPSPSTQATNHPEDPEQVTAATSAQTASDSAKEETAPSGNYFLKILVLFLVAIAVAALMRPKPVEPTPSPSEASTGQSMTPPVVPATQESVAPENGTGSAAGVASGQADVKSAATSELSPANTPATNAPASNAATSSATEPAVPPAKAPSER
jgi:transcriptional regulator with XRE-family HTH domain